jgi:hypothetical protein
MLDFDEQQGPSVVYVERLGHGTILEDPPTLDAHALMFSGVTSLALEANESLDLIRSTTRVYRRNAATLI